MLGQVVSDLNAADGPRALHEACQKIAPVDVVIHNAGMACLGYYEEVPRDRMQLQMRVMLTAPMELTQRAGDAHEHKGHLAVAFVFAGICAVSVM